jgi:hypothetical protein
MMVIRDDFTEAAEIAATMTRLGPYAQHHRRLAGPLSLQVRCSTYLRTADHAQIEQGLKRR